LRQIAFTDARTFILALPETLSVPQQKNRN